MGAIMAECYKIFQLNRKNKMAMVTLVLDFLRGNCWAIKQSKISQTNKPNINDLLPGDLLGDDEQVIFAIKPSFWTIAFLSFSTVLLMGVIIAATLTLGPLLRLERYSIQVVNYCLVLAMGRIGFAGLQWLSRSYVLTDQRVIRIRGVFTIDIFQCSLERIQNTFLTLTLPERVLGLGSIALTTAGTGAVEAVWRHVKDPLDVHHRLLNAMNTSANRSPGQP
jgi:hypothetical protein